MMDMMNNGHGSMMGGMWFFSILFWVLIIAGVVFITRWFLERGRNKEGSGVNGDSALAILEKRYAKGEIDRETFEQMKKDIEP
jgi:putative membrane protein